MARIPRQLITLRVEAADMIDSIDAAEPIDRNDAAEPMLPMERTDPTLPMERKELREAMLSTLRSERRLHSEDLLTAVIWSS